MGVCFSSANKVSGSNSTSNNNSNRPQSQQQEQKQQQQDQPLQQKPRETQRNSPPQNRQQHHHRRKRSSGAVPYGKRTDFGYDKDFECKYSTGKLLGHGQFGYTFVATDKSTGDRVAVKRIDKNKVKIRSFQYSDSGFLLIWWILCARLILGGCAFHELVHIDWENSMIPGIRFWILDLR